MDFQPHGCCILWNPWVLWPWVIFNGLIFGSYMSISYQLYGLRGMIGQILAEGKFDVLWWFAAFIVLCGWTHLVDIITMWDPIYWMANSVLCVCAIASVRTALRFPKFVKQLVTEFLFLKSEVLRLQEVIKAIPQHDGFDVKFDRLRSILGVSNA